MGGRVGTWNVDVVPYPLTAYATIMVAVVAGDVVFTRVLAVAHREVLESEHECARTRLDDPGLSAPVWNSSAPMNAPVSTT